MPGEDTIVLQGAVIETLGDTRFRVRIVGGRTVLADVADELREQSVRIIPGDRVTVEFPPEDLTHGRITWRA